MRFDETATVAFISSEELLALGVIYDRAHHRDIDGFGGLASLMPVYSAVSTLGFFAAMGLPGLSSFISEVLVLLGAWQRYPNLAIMGALVIVLTAGYMLWMIQRMYLGAINERYAGITEINGRELFTLIPPGIIVIAVGVYPQPILELLSGTLNQINGIVLHYS